MSPFPCPVSQIQISMSRRARIELGSSKSNLRISVSAHPTIINSVFNDNVSNDVGGGMYNNGSGRFTVANTIEWGNRPDKISNTLPAPAPAILFRDIQNSGGSGAGWDVNLGTDGGGNIDVDPLFADVDLRLQPGSPCIDADDPDFVVNPDAPSDIGGESRIMGCRVDMVIDEFTADDPAPGDFDGGGIVDMSDLPMFVESLLGPTTADVCVGDMNDDDVLNGEDVQVFVEEHLAQ